MLSTSSVKAARARASAYKIADERGLHLFVAPTGRKSFRLRFRWQGHEQLLTIGQWPEVSLDAARARAEAAREQLSRGVDPRTIRAAVTFEAAARDWHAHRRPGWTAVHADDVLDSLVADVFPAIGADELAAIDSPAVLRVVRAVERRGAIATARRIRQRISDVFAYAVSEGWCASDPAAVVGRALAPAPAARHQPALVAVDDVRALLAAADRAAGGAMVKLASRFLALTAVRLSAVRGARWREIEDLDGAAPLWRVPAARMKLRAAKKLDAANEHLVPLAPAAVAVLRTARAAAGGDDDALIFAGRGAGAPIGENAIGDLYDRAGFAGRHVAHGWRASFSTILNERFPDERGAIDRALGHILKREDGSAAKVEGAYNRAQLLDARRRLFDAWAAILTD
ncbi:integrase [Sphingomonas ginsenosidimutans]|jgi:integrase|uniref:Integrase n=1 Tax=Sphingomonas ginsenosidimutans TaxID=862134 RepID=A0A2A4HVW9_9SPHN|nr:integrase arm-type DNA-binding domain-containing protein [Sphingomonas ginsenosidimutans]PCG08676.1 integrase [Sphingomonas ginsenosidimutans]